MKSIKISAAAAALAVLCAVVFSSFFTYTDIGEKALNEEKFSSVYSENDTRIYFAVSGENLKYIYTHIYPNSESSKNTNVYFSLKNSQGDTLYEKTLNGNDAYSFSRVNLSGDFTLEKGEEYSVLISSDAQSEKDGWKIPLAQSGTTIYTKNSDTSYVPDIHFVYNRFNIKLFVLCILIFVFCLAALFAPKSKYWSRYRFYIGVFLFTAAPLVNIWMCEWANFGSIFQKHIGVVLLNYIICAAVSLLFLAVSGSTAVAVTAQSVIMAALGITGHYIYIFRGNPLNYFDVLVVGTAMDVSESYSLSLDMYVIFAVLTALVIISLSWRYNINISKSKNIKKRAVVLALSLCITAFSFSGASLNFSKGVYNVFLPKKSIESMGVLYNFVYGMASSGFKEPKDYTKETVLKENQKYTGVQTENIHPDIVLIMNESLTDYSKFVNIDACDDPLSYIHSLENDTNPNTYVSSVITPALGGATCNTEFEAFTGLSMRNITCGGYPYSQYVNENSYGVSEYLSALGYETTYIHPGNDTAYNRNNVYSYFGFDNMIFEDDFKNPEYIREFISDKSCYDVILDKLNKSENPQFIFNVTIQNHGAWDYYDKEKEISLASPAENITEPFEVILNLYNQSDEAFEYLIENLEKRDRPTLVIMFGDHHPGITKQLQEYIGFDSALKENPLVQYQTPVIFWSNYDIDTSDIPELFSTNYLNAVMTKTAGLSLNGQQQFLLEMMEELPVYNISGIYDKNLNLVKDSSYIDVYQRSQYAALTQSQILPDKFLQTK